MTPEQVKEKLEGVKWINKELADGTILDKETTLSQEEFDKNPPVIPAGHPFYNIWAGIIQEK